MSLDRRNFLKLAGAGLCLPAFGAVGRATAADSRLPNIVLCMADDQGWGDMAYNGHPVLHTPNFDRMAQETLRFDRFYAAHPVCSPTRASVLTGRNPNRMGCFSWGRTIRPQEVTIAEALKTAGYTTAHFGKWHVGAARHGSPVNPSASGFDHWLSAPNFYDNDPILSRNGRAEQLQGESSIVAVDAALEFIRRNAQDGPFLAVVWFGSPHSPHRAVAQDRAHYADQPEELQHFYGEVTGMDRAFGKLRDSLREMGIHENTILWYCSDNGGLPEVGSTGGRGHKGQIYEGGLRVPALLEWPARFTGPMTTDLPVSTSDIYPTLLEWTGVSVPDQPRLDGVSLAGLIGGGMDGRPPIGFWNYPESGVPTPAADWMAELKESQARGSWVGEVERLRTEAAEIQRQYPEDTWPGHAAWLDWPWKLHRIQREGMPLRLELYNLETDPDEREDLAGSRRERTESMRAQLEFWQRSVMQSLNGEDYL